MEWFVDNWPILLIGLGIFIVITSLVRQVAKLAFLGVAVGVIGLIIWPMVGGAL